MIGGLGPDEEGGHGVGMYGTGRGSGKAEEVGIWREPLRALRARLRPVR